MDKQARTDEDRALRVQLDLRLDRQPITGRLHTEAGRNEPFVGWLGFVDALRTLHEEQSTDPAATQGASRDRATTEGEEPR